MICAEIYVKTVLAICWENNPVFAVKPHYTHCHVHLLSLLVKDVTKNTKSFQDTISTAEEITILIKYSPKQENILGNINEQIECKNDSDFHANNLLKVSEIRWTVRAVCFKRILGNCNVLWNVWKYSLQNDQMKTELKLHIIGVQTQLETFHQFFGLSLGHRIFPIPISYLKPYRLKNYQHAAVKD